MTLGVLASLLVLAACIVFWNRSGLALGRKTGNRVADFLLIDRNVFHTILDNGTGDRSLLMLAAMKKQGMPVDKISSEIAPYLLTGIQILETRFGEQPQIMKARPVVERLMNSEFGAHS